MAELLPAAAGALGPGLGRWFAFVLVACALVCCNRVLVPNERDGPVRRA